MPQWLAALADAPAPLPAAAQLAVLHAIPHTRRATAAEEATVRQLLTRADTAVETLTAAVAHPQGCWSAQLCAHPGLTVAHVRQLDAHPWRLVGHDRAQLLAQLCAHPNRQVADAACLLLGPDGAAAADAPDAAFAVWAAGPRQRRWLLRHVDDDALAWVGALYSGNYQLTRSDLDATVARYVPTARFARKHRQTARGVLRQLKVRGAVLAPESCAALGAVARGLRSPAALRQRRGRAAHGSGTSRDGLSVWTCRRLGDDRAAWDLLVTLLGDGTDTCYVELVEAAVVLAGPRCSAEQGDARRKPAGVVGP